MRTCSSLIRRTGLIEHRKAVPRKLTRGGFSFLGTPPINGAEVEVEQ